MIGKNFLVHKAFGAAMKSVFQRKQLFPKLNASRWKMAQTSKESYFGKFPLWSTGHFYHCRDVHYGPEQDKDLSNKIIWDAQLTIPNDSGYARLETNLGIRQAKKG
ncbi:hypothetical protein TNCV_4731631 [Trichonephila clavipes]|nr:hypothetical protein TNCV_4731631 [Trichonephila clavipes]